MLHVTRVCNMWYELGVKLLEDKDIKLSLLDKIKADRPDDCKTCCIEMFRHRLTYVHQLLLEMKAVSFATAMSNLLMFPSAMVMDLIVPTAIISSSQMEITDCVDAYFPVKLPGF